MRRSTYRLLLLALSWGLLMGACWTHGFASVQLRDVGVGLVGGLLVVHFVWWREKR